MKVEIELTESQAETLLNMLLAEADNTINYTDVSKFGEEGRQTIKEQVALAIMFYESVTRVFPKVAECDSVEQFWMDGKKYRDFVEAI